MFEIPTLLIQPGSDVWACADRGTLLVPLWLASELGVAPGPGGQHGAVRVRSSALDLPLVAASDRVF